MDRRGHPLQIGVGEACAERWQRLFRPFTNADTPAVVSVRNELARIAAAKRNSIYRASGRGGNGKNDLSDVSEDFMYSAASVSGPKSKRCLYFLVSKDRVSE